MKRISLKVIAFCICSLVGSISFAQSINTTSAYGCSGNSNEIVMFLIGGNDCASPEVTLGSNWSVVPSTGVTITPVKTSIDPAPAVYNQVRIKFLEPGTYSVFANFICAGNFTAPETINRTIEIFQSGMSPSVSLISDGTSACNSSIQFTAQPINGGTSPSYIWRINDQIVPNQNGYNFLATPGLLNHGDQVTVTLYSSLECTTQAVANSTNSISVTKWTSVPIPATTNLVFCDFEFPELSIPLSYDRGLFKWFDGEGALLGEGSTFKTSILTQGLYSFQAELQDEFGCKSEIRTTVNLTITPNCDQKLNWVKTTGFHYSNGGFQQSLASQSISYFDLAGKPLQSQTKSFSNGGNIFSSSVIQDQLGRNALSTLSAPMYQSDFQYKYRFVLDQNGGLYDYSDFNAPLGNQEGTLGWYYSSANPDAYTPKSGYPFTRNDFYEDGHGEVRRVASVGEEFRLGQGKEGWSGAFPVFNELNDYLVRRRAFDMSDNRINNSLQGEAIQSVSRDQNGKFALSINDKAGRTVLSAIAGTNTDYDLAITNAITATAGENVKFIYFYLLAPTTVNLTPNQSSYTVENLISNTSAQTFESNGVWPSGFYRLIVNTGSVTLTYSNYLKDVSQQFYDDVGRLKASVSPNGYKQWLSGISLNKIDKTTYKYNHQGWLLQMTEPDAGTTNYIYRKDGKIRFSQNAKQKTLGSFSYTHYDKLGRPVESGEYLPAGQSDIQFITMSDPAFGSSLIKNELGNTIEDINWTGEKKDWVKTFYDLVTAPDEVEQGELLTIESQTGITNRIQENLVQNYMRGAVAYSKNENNKTWYSYDELGRVTWIAQLPIKLLPSGDKVVFVTRYEYDYSGNVLQTSTVMYRAGILQSSSSFFHHYVYDEDFRLKEVYTSTDGLTKKLRAKYQYYLHGPLKRIELGDKIQGIDFVYNIQGWLTQINHPDNLQDPGSDGSSNGFRPDAFGMALDYFESSLNGVYTSSTSHRINERHHLPETYVHTDSQNKINSLPVFFMETPFQLTNDAKYQQLNQQGVKESLQSIRSKPTTTDN